MSRERQGSASRARASRDALREPRRCWCGGPATVPFGPDYKGCESCGSLVVRTPPEGDVTRVHDDERDLYGRRYWFEHQAELHQDDLERRSRSDLHERCLHWLRALLRYRRPPGRTLELGCAHGGFVHLLGRAGFDATGLELSPWVVAFAQRTFGVPMLTGPLEDQDLEPGTFDVIIAMDVLEHLPDPRATLRHAATLLRDDGLLVLQTPCRPADAEFDALITGRHRFLEMLLPREHLHLFSAMALTRLLGEVGLSHVSYEPAMFPHYDMMAVASREPLPLPRRATDGPAETAAGRDVEAMLALYTSYETARDGYLQADADRVARQTQLDALTQRQAAEREKQAIETQRRAAEAASQAAAIDRHIAQATERTVEINRLIAEAKQRVTESEELQAANETTERERAALAASLAKEQAHRDALAREHQALVEAHADLDRRHAVEQRQHEGTRRRAEGLASERDQAQARREEIERDLASSVTFHGNAVTTFEATAQALGRACEERDRSYTEHRQQDTRVSALRALVAEYRSGRIYRSLVRLGRWRTFDARLERALAAPAPLEVASEHRWSLAAARTIEPTDGPGVDDAVIAIDLTAIRPHGENGGASLVARALAQAFIRDRPEHHWLLLTTDANHALFDDLDAPNVERRGIVPTPAAWAALRAEVAIDVLFCPMTAPPFRDPAVPLVSVVYDLQYRTYPDFFSAEERVERDHQFRRAVAASTRILTISEYVRQTVLANTDLSADSVVTAPIGLSRPLSTFDASPNAEDDEDAVLAAWHLRRDQYLLYPANVWPHKNHRMLLVALGMARSRRPDLDLRLVLTGANQPDPAPLARDAEGMRLGDAVVFAGYVDANVLDVLYRGCRALVFPSLYEGFGMPVLEAMAHERPVLCSDVTALPEVVGDAALRFDPRKPDAMADAMERIATDDALVADLVTRGRERVRAMGDLDAMATTCLGAIEDVLRDPPPVETALIGVLGDGWTGQQFSVVFASGVPGRHLRCVLVSPYGTTGAVEIEARSGTTRRRFPIYHHRPLSLDIVLPEEAGCIDFVAQETFNPARFGLGDDPRVLSLQVAICQVDLGDGKQQDLLAVAMDSL